MCNKCGGETCGWICPICGWESADHTPVHLHVVDNVIIIVRERCKSCNQPDIACTCRQVIFSNYLFKELEYDYQYMRAGYWWWWDY